MAGDLLRRQTPNSAVHLLGNYNAEVGLLNLRERS